MERETKLRMLNRLNRIEGEVRGIARMVEEDRNCIDILTQLQVARAGLVRLEVGMLNDHLELYIKTARSDDDIGERRRKTAEIIQLLARTGE